jgi:serine/threonine protein kinase
MYLEYLHIVHGDLAARNILIDDSKTRPGEYIAKITDFELAHDLGNNNQIEIPSTESELCVYLIFFVNIRKT